MRISDGSSDVCSSDLRVQEAQTKWPALRAASPDISLHLIGQLQSNKADEAVELFDAIHSVDRVSLVTELARAMDKAGRRHAVFVEVHIGCAEQRGGTDIATLTTLPAPAPGAALPAHAPVFRP